MKKYISLVVLSLTFWACQPYEIPLYSGESYIYFQKESSQTTSVSFAVMPGLDEYVINIPITVIGIMSTADQPFGIEVVTTGDNHTTLSPASYSISSAPLVRKGHYNDSLSVTLYRTDEIRDKELKLVVALRDNEHYKVRMPDYSTATIIVSDMMVRPDWWTPQFETIFFGPYSEEKYMAFITATGEWDLTEKSNDEIVGYMRDFIYYLRAMDEKGTPVYESDGVTKVLDSITYTNA